MERELIDLKGIMGIPFLKKSRFTGSCGQLRYVLEKRNAETVPDGALWPAQNPTQTEAAGGGVCRTGDCLAAIAWRGPYCSDATPEEEKTTAYFAFTKEGLAQAQAWLNSR